MQTRAHRQFLVEMVAITVAVTLGYFVSALPIMALHVSPFRPPAKEAPFWPQSNLQRMAVIGIVVGSAALLWFILPGALDGPIPALRENRIGLTPKHTLTLMGAVGFWGVYAALSGFKLVRAIRKTEAV